MNCVLCRSLRDEDSYLLAPARHLSSRSQLSRTQFTSRPNGISVSSHKAQQGGSPCQPGRQRCFTLDSMTPQTFGYRMAKQSLLARTSPTVHVEADATVAERRSKPGALFNSSARDALKVRLFRSAVELILLSGMEAVPVTPSRENATDASHGALLRYALGVHFPDRIATRRLTARVGARP